MKKKFAILFLVLFFLLGFDIYTLCEFNYVALIYSIFVLFLLCADMIRLTKNKYKKIEVVATILAILSSFAEIPNLLLFLRLFKDNIPLIFITIIDILLIIKFLYFTGDTRGTQGDGSKPLKKGDFSNRHKRKQRQNQSSK